MEHDNTEELKGIQWEESAEEDLVHTCRFACDLCFGHCPGNRGGSASPHICSDPTFAGSGKV